VAENFYVPESKIHVPNSKFMCRIRLLRANPRFICRIRLLRANPTIYVPNSIITCQSNDLCAESDYYVPIHDLFVESNFHVPIQRFMCRIQFSRANPTIYVPNPIITCQSNDLCAESDIQQALTKKSPGSIDAWA
jgi:hypothetical protein